MKQVAIVGVGLIGGSFALALRRSGFNGRISGVSSPATIERAMQMGVVDTGGTLAEACADADLIYLAQPISAILDTIRKLRGIAKPDALVTDAGSTKHRIVTAAQEHLSGTRFLGGHPMAGKETRGVAGADAELFRGRPYVLCPSGVAADESFVELLKRIGARVEICGAEEHDRLVAFSSHLAQLASTALAATIQETSPESIRVAGPGLVDATRLALSNYDLWRDILATNSLAITEALTAYIGKLEHLRENLRSRELQREFEAGANLARALREQNHPAV
jgi:prephenate dehydrogenase